MMFGIEIPENGARGGPDSAGSNALLYGRRWTARARGPAWAAGSGRPGVHRLANGAPPAECPPIEGLPSVALGNRGGQQRQRCARTRRGIGEARRTRSRGGLDAASSMPNPADPAGVEENEEPLQPPESTARARRSSLQIDE